jgi:hypothetical protein
MITIPLQLPEDLAKEVLPLQDRLPEIIALGLRQWRKRPTLTARQQVERQPPVRAGGKPASEIIIEERGAL